MVPIDVGPVVRVVVVVYCIRASAGIGWVCYSGTVPEVVMVPWVGRLGIESGRPKHYFVLVQHSIGVVVLIDIVPETVVVVVPWRNEGSSTCHLDYVDQPVGIPIIL